MKKLSTLTLIATLLFIGIPSANSQAPENETPQEPTTVALTAESLTGVWQQLVLNYETQQVQYVPIFKIFNSDGTYVHMRANAGGSPAYFNAVGKWEIVADDKFLEYVEPSGNLVKRTEEQICDIVETSDKRMIMRSQFRTMGTQMEYKKEMWIKCQLRYPVN